MYSTPAARIFQSSPKKISEKLACQPSTFPYTILPRLQEVASITLAKHTFRPLNYNDGHHDYFLIITPRKSSCGYCPCPASFHTISRLLSSSIMTEVKVDIKRYLILGFDPWPGVVSKLSQDIALKIPFRANGCLITHPISLIYSENLGTYGNKQSIEAFPSYNSSYLCKLSTASLHDHIILRHEPCVPLFFSKKNEWLESKV